jgi:uncharacterized flavoprotein (TIGR03862 family)
MIDDDRRTATIVGGGPAGLMAAEVLATAGVRVTVFEHMPSVGRKLLLAGRGGLNITHSEPLDDLVARLGPAADRLAVPLQAFSPGDLRAWCASLGQTTFVGSSGRVFPESFRATPLLRAWLARLRDLGVTIEVRHRWVGFGFDDTGRPAPHRSRFARRDGAEIEVGSDVTVLALGGASWPRVGSDGSWVDVLRGAGVEVTALRPSNCGLLVDWSPAFVERFSGVPLKNVALAFDGDHVRGDAMIVDDGIEGGPVYALSAPIRDAIERDGRCTITVDLHPDLSIDRVVGRLEQRRPKDSTSATLRRLGLSAVAVAFLRECASPLPTDPVALAALVKAAPLTVVATMGIERAISTAGGIALGEVDEGFMLRRLPGVFVAGEMLDWEAPTGGYLLQTTFSTAVAAARAALAHLAP